MRRTLRLLLAAAAVVALLPLGSAGARADATTVAVWVSGSGTVTAPGILCGNGHHHCSLSTDGTTALKLEATPGKNSIFAGWSGDCSGSLSPCILVIPNGTDVHVQATFGYLEVVDVSTEGDGLGTVVSDPSGIECGHACATAYAGGTIVNLAAIPKKGSVFVGWRGWCKGQGGCTLQATGTASVSAVFAKQAPADPKAAPISVENQGASAATSKGQRILVLDFRTSQPALVRLAIAGPAGYTDSTRLNVRAGAVRVELPLGAGAPAGRYRVVAQLTAAGGERTLRWSVAVG
jgi:hypothetical protein